ncbi:MAG: hypothetical protein KAU16_01485 [Methanophagales archaeon]|nr:hypothetical protein [Methanophagales archaeon]
MAIAREYANFSASAICEMQLILRSCGSGVGGVERNGMECRTFFGVAGFAPEPNF